MRKKKRKQKKRSKCLIMELIKLENKIHDSTWLIWRWNTACLSQYGMRLGCIGCSSTWLPSFHHFLFFIWFFFYQCRVWLALPFSLSIMNEAPLICPSQMWKCSVPFQNLLYKPALYSRKVYLCFKWLISVWWCECSPSMQSPSHSFLPILLSSLAWLEKNLQSW